MRRRRGVGSAVVGLTLGLLIGIAWRAGDLRNNVTMANNEEEETGSNIREEGTTFGEDWQKEEERKTSLVYVGVMTAKQYLGTRAKAVWETWGKDLPGKIEFFSSEFSSVPDNCTDLPLVPLPRVTDVYPPQKKSFLMLQYMWKKYRDRYEWFVRADDDVYVKADRLEKFLRSVDSRKPMYIGQAGRGNADEFGTLALEYNENYCMGGPGVIISRETLNRIVPHIKYCLKNLYTTHEDVELGRCVQKYAGIPCTWSYEMQTILHHNGNDDAFTGNLKRKEIHRAITLHPVKKPPHMYRIHNYMRGLRIQELQQERVRLHRDVGTMSRELGMGIDDFKKRPLAKNVTLFPNVPDFENYPGDTKVLGLPAGLRSFRPRRSREVIPWDFYSRSEFTLGDLNPRRRVHSDVKEGLDEITREVMASINLYSRQRGRIVEERSALYGYRRVDAYGADTILDLLLVYRKYRGRKVTLPVRRHVYLHQHFTGLEIREVVDCVEVDREERPSKKSRLGIFPAGFLSFNGDEAAADPLRSKRIKFILPLAGRFAIFERFLKNYEEICLLRDHQTDLVVVLYRREDDDSYYKTLDLIEKMRYKYGYDKITVLEGDGEFSRGRALGLGVSRAEDKELLFFVDVDIVFTASALVRIRLNTVLNRRLYFPVVFSQFNPKIIHNQNEKYNHFAIDEKSGFWRQFGFGIVSIYKEDFREIGGFDLTIKGWGKEDIDLYEKAIKSKINVFRSPDKNLIHVYHEVECDEKLIDPQLAMCKGTRADIYANTEVLAQIIYDHPEYLRFAKSRIPNLTNSAG
ncbi:chondroitin sulfate synthase 1 [Venturia canescens]|uniref:chondroitin sulfate synthase 1 n=1 Tax=Venturia canescens TaxID=32260 RepID=UPI001C9C1B80|nr:chondroitin sulfate synthase 1 [Venturia canescens]XP_043284510.1 chondroitin sulfate synthase 1 [Venturia canescens]XP_043284511.1 chondroitin sulfate synthase 1 [Venturia canescens]